MIACMSSGEARELIIEGINFAAYRETDSSLHDSDKNRLFGSDHCFSPCAPCNPPPLDILVHDTASSRLPDSSLRLTQFT